MFAVLLLIISCCLMKVDVGVVATSNNDLKIAGVLPYFFPLSPTAAIHQHPTIQKDFRRVKRNDDADDDEKNDEFVPEHMFIQVRKYENIQHVPPSILEPRLRELVKDSRIHSEYSEEGYEESDYDHGDREKMGKYDEEHQSESYRQKIKRSSSPNTKYPYYNSESVNEDSPLRYAQNMDDIPNKSEGGFAFYAQADKIPCKELPNNVNLDKKETERLGGLNDAINCMKNKYFGADPLDSPFFTENDRQSKELDVDNANSTQPPETAALQMRLRRRRRPLQKHQQYRRVLPNPIIYYQNTTPRSKYATSEVYYKHEIKPSEQLNVFADVINNIKNASKDNLASTDSKLSRRSKLPYHKNLTMMRPSKTNKVHMKSYLKNRKHINQKSPPKVVDSVGEGSEAAYTTIDTPMNLFLVPGMKPPSKFAKPLIYSDFTGDNLLRRNLLLNHRVKRSTRFSYSEIRRTTKKPQDDDESDDSEEEDDYVPHRAINYKYDPNSSKIVYDKSSRTSTTTPVYEQVYEEVDEEEPEEKPEVKPKIHRTVYHKDVLNKENGPTILDIIAQLRAHPDYKVIKDPEPTEKTTTTTLTPEKTTPPEFLSIISKLHSNKDYKPILDEEDMKLKQTTTTTTTVEPEVEETEEDEEVLTNIQNSPGGQFTRDDFQLFDVNDYLPKVKNYSPRTSIDYSKYKTIERTTSKTSQEDDDSDEIVAEQIERKQDNLSSQEALIETTLPAVTSTTTKSPTTTTTRRRFRTRNRSTTQSPISLPTSTASSTTIENKVSETTPLATSHRPLSRIYPRRPRPKIRLNAAVLNESSTESLKRIQRRLLPFPSNHKTFYTPIEERDIRSMKLEQHPRLVTPDIINYNRTKLEDLPPGIQPRKVEERIANGRGNYLPGKAVKESKFERKTFNYEAEDDTKIIITNKNGQKTAIIKDPSKRQYFYAPL